MIGERFSSSDAQRRGFALIALLLASLGCSYPASSASAATVSRTEDGLFVFAAGTGEANQLVVSYPDFSTVSFADHAVPVFAASDACTEVSSGRVDCSDVAETPSFRVDAGDADDLVRMDSIDLGGSCFGAEAFGGPGDDDLWGVGNEECYGAGIAIHGGPGADRLRSGTYGLEMYGDEGDDHLFWRTTEPNLYDGGPGDDWITTSEESDYIEGGPGSDTIDHGDRETWRPVVVDLDLPNGGGEEVSVSGIENIRGGSGNDVLAGDGGANELFGGPGDDLLDGAAGIDLIHGGNGIDTVDYSARHAPVNAALQWDYPSGNDEDGPASSRDHIDGLDVENLRGGSGADHLIGNDGSNWLFGGAGDDILDLRGLGSDAATCGDGYDALLGNVFVKHGPDCESLSLIDPFSGRIVGPNDGKPPDRRAPVAWLRLPGKQNLRSALRYGFTVTVTCDESCRLDARLVLTASAAKRLGLSRTGRLLAEVSLPLAAAGTRPVAMRIKSAKLRRRMLKAKLADLQLGVLARDAGGNARGLDRRLTFKPSRAAIGAPAPGGS